MLEALTFPGIHAEVRFQQGLTSEEVVDSDNDGEFDLLALDFGLNITTPGEYRLEGVLKDCNGSRIELIDQSLRLEKTANISGMRS